MSGDNSDDPVASVALTGIHFFILGVTISILAVKGVVYDSVFILLALSLTFADISMLPYWTGEATPTSPPWTVSGSWGFILINYLLFLYAAYALDAYIGAERDLLGRALSRTAGKALRQGRRKVERENEETARVLQDSSDQIQASAEPAGGANMVLGTARYDDDGESLQSGETFRRIGQTARSASEASHEPDDLAIFEQSAYSENGTNTNENDGYYENLESDGKFSNVNLGGATQSSHRGRQLDVDPRERVNSSSSDDESDVLGPVRSRRNRRLPRPAHLKRNVTLSGFDIIARVLPRRIFEAAKSYRKAAASASSGDTLGPLDESTAELIGMGPDIASFVVQYKKRKLFECCVWYLLSVGVLLGMAAMEQVATEGRIVGWFNVGWVLLGDSIMLLNLIPASSRRSSMSNVPKTSAISSASSTNPDIVAAQLKAEQMTTASLQRRKRRDRGWLSSVPLVNLTPPLWVLLLLLLGCRAALVTVPLYLNFAAQCISYIICATYLLYIILNEHLRSKRWMKLPIAHLIVLTFWLVLDTTLIGLTTVIPSVATYMGESRKFSWDSTSPTVNEWILGLASVSLVVAFTLVYIGLRFRNSMSLWAWLGVYVFICLSGFALDCIALGQVSIKLGIFSSCATLVPAVAFIVLAFGETISATPPRPRLVFYLIMSFVFEGAWAFALEAVNSDTITYFIFIVVLQVNAFVSLVNALALFSHCVLVNWPGYFCLIFSLLSFLAVFPVAFVSVDHDDPGEDHLLATTLISMLMLPSIALFALCSLRLGDLGWDSIVSLGPSSRMFTRVVLLRIAFVSSGLCLIGAVVLTALYFDATAATWLGTLTTLVYFAISSIQARFIEKPFSPTAMVLRLVMLCCIAGVLFVFAIVDSQRRISLDLQHVEGAFDSWAHFLIAGFILFTFALFDFTVAIFYPAPNHILSPSERLFGLPVVRYSIERKGGEIFVHNVHVMTCLGCFVILDILGFVVSLAGGSKPWGTVLSSAAFCLVCLLAFHLKHLRVHGFRADLSRVNLTSSVAEDAFATVLKDTVRKIRQFSTRTAIFDSQTKLGSAVCPGEMRHKLKREDRQKSLAFFFCMFNLALKRRLRQVWQEDKLRQRRERRLKTRGEEQYDSEQEDGEEAADSPPQQESLRQDPASSLNAKMIFEATPKQKTITSLPSEGNSRGDPADVEDENDIQQAPKIVPNATNSTKGNLGDTSGTTVSRRSSLSSLRNLNGNDVQHSSISGNITSIEIPKPDNIDRTVNHSSNGFHPSYSSQASRPLLNPENNFAQEKLIKGNGAQENGTRATSSTTHIMRTTGENHLLSHIPLFNSSRLTSRFFVDDTFPPYPEMILAEWDSELMDDLVEDMSEFYLWLRPHEICGETKRIGLRSFPESASCTTVDPRQVQQGAVADCWLLSALSVVALKQVLFDRVLPAKTLSPDGKYTVRLFDFISGEWTDVVIDDCLPCDPDTRKPMFAGSRSGNVFWMSLVEKAFAKRLGGWPMLNEGQVHRALGDLTGGFSQLFSFEDDFELVESGALWSAILTWARSGHLLVLGSSDIADDFGLVKEHAYAVLSVVEVHDSRGRHRLLQLQDPWGKSDWRGRWSDADKKRWSPRAKWTVAMQSELVITSEERAEMVRSALKNPTSASTLSVAVPSSSQAPGGSIQKTNSYDDEDLEANGGDMQKFTTESNEGTFWMEFDDVAMLFKWLFSCRMFSDNDGWVHRDIVAEWKDDTAGGPPHLSLTRKNPQFSLKFTKTTSANDPAGGVSTSARKRMAVVFISICNLEEKLFYPYMSLLLLHLGGSKVSGSVLASQVVASTGKYKDARELSMEVALPMDKVFTLLPSLARPGEEGRFRLSIHAKVPFELARIT